jgi:hypothetical protein
MPLEVRVSKHPRRVPTHAQNVRRSPEPRTPKEKIIDILNRNGIDLKLHEFGEVVRDVAEVLADKIEAEEPYATESIRTLRVGGSTIENHLGYLEDE